MKEKLQYPYVWAWGKLMHHPERSTEALAAQAERENAPENATFRDTTGVWITTDDINRQDVRNSLDIYKQQVEQEYAKKAQ